MSYDVDRRRLKRISVQMDSLLDFILYLGGTDKLSWSAYLPSFEIVPLPKDCRYVESYYNQESRSLRIVLWHPDFDPIPEGEEIPYVPNTGKFLRLKDLMLNLTWEAWQTRCIGKRSEEILEDMREHPSVAIPKMTKEEMDEYVAHLRRVKDRRNQILKRQGLKPAHHHSEKLCGEYGYKYVHSPIAYHLSRWRD